MKTATQFSITKLILLVMVIFAASTTLSSCKDDKDEPYKGSEIVGTWYYYDEDEHEFDYDDFFTFKEDGTFFCSFNGDGRYSYDSKSTILELRWNNGDDTEIGRAPISGNKLDLDDFYCGIYYRR